MSGGTDTLDDRPRVAIFRPAGDRLHRAEALLSDLGVTPVADPLLAVEPTGALPRSDAAVVVLTSQTGADLIAEAGWAPADATLAAIGPKTAGALEAAGYPVGIVPETYSSQGLVAALEETVEGRRVEVARSDHGSHVLLDGLDQIGAYHHETVLYRLVRPPMAGDATEQVAAGTIDATLFTSSLTVEHFLDAATERGVRDAALAGLREALVGTIGEPTRETAEEHGISVDVVSDEATMDALAKAIVDRLA